MITLIFYEMIKMSTWLMTKMRWNESNLHRIIDISDVQFRNDEDIFELDQENFVKDAERKIVIVKGVAFPRFWILQCPCRRTGDVLPTSESYTR